MSARKGDAFNISQDHGLVFLVHSVIEFLLRHLLSLDIAQAF